MPRSRFLSYFPGLFLAGVVGGISYSLSLRYAVLDPLIISIVLGIFVRTAIGDRALLEPGLVFAPRVFIPLGIIFYGVNLSFDKVASVEGATWLQVAIGIIAIFIAGDFLGRGMKLRSPLAALINVGTAICGASAIALATPIVKARNDETSQALLTITIWGALGLAAFPLLQKALSMGWDNYALLCATGLHQTGFVKAAAKGMGGDCLALATSIKVARTMMVIPVLFFLSWQDGGLGQGRQSRHPFAAAPWFLWLFIGVGIIFSFVPAVKEYGEPVKAAATVLWTLAMAGLGLSVNIKALLPKIGRPLAYGLLIWLVVVINYFVGYYGMGY